MFLSKASAEAKTRETGLAGSLIM